MTCLSYSLGTLTRFYLFGQYVLCISAFTHFNRLYKSVFHGFLKIETLANKGKYKFNDFYQGCWLGVFSGTFFKLGLERVPAVLNLRSKKITSYFTFPSTVVTYFICICCLIYWYHFFKFILFLFFVLFCIVESNCWN